MQIVGEDSDEGHSGKNIAGRPDFMRLLENIEDEISAVTMRIENLQKINYQKNLSIEFCYPLINYIQSLVTSRKNFLDPLLRMFSFMTMNWRTVGS